MKEKRILPTSRVMVTLDAKDTITGKKRGKKERRVIGTVQNEGGTVFHKPVRRLRAHRSVSANNGDCAADFISLADFSVRRRPGEPVYSRKRARARAADA